MLYNLYNSDSSKSISSQLECISKLKIQNLDTSLCRITSNIERVPTASVFRSVLTKIRVVAFSRKIRLQTPKLSLLDDTIVYVPRCQLGRLIISEDSL